MSGKPFSSERKERVFWERVDIPHGGFGCWNWIGAKTSAGYGNTRFDYSNMSAHRVMWIKVYGHIEPGLFVCHHCDNPSCVNPDHLFLGTCQDNTDDMKRKGRQNIGVRNPSARVNENDVRAIRSLLRTGSWKQREIATVYGLNQVTVSEISLRKTWRHVA